MTTSLLRDWCEHIASVISADAYADWSVFALIDPASGNLDDTANPPFRVSRHALPLKYRDLPPEMTPYLLKSEPGSDFERAQFIEWAMQGMLADHNAPAPRAFRFAALTMCPRKSASLARTLATAALVVDTSRATRLLRYWDPRVAQHLDQLPLRWPALSDEYPGLWWYVDARAQLRTHHIDPRTPPLLILTPEQQAALLHASDLNACLELAHPGSGSFGTGAQAWAPLDACLNVAQHEGLSGNSRLSFAAHRWLAGEAIERTSRMREILHTCERTGIAYETLQAELAEHDWLNLITEARSQQAQQAQERKPA